ncbi:MAG: penicillin-binding transpeptidase domain-containing protein [Tepidisphaeraceae bacterium]
MKGRELAIDQPCIDACVHYEAVAFMRPLRSLRQTAWERLLKADAGVAALSEDDQRRRLDAEVSKVIGETSPATLKWLRTKARQRVRRQVETYDDKPLAEKWRLLNAGVIDVISDIETMWHELARLTKQTDEQMDDQRRQIVRRVETRRRLVWYAKYNNASKDRDEPGWLETLLGSGGPVDLDKFDVHVSEESEAHVVLANIDYDTRTTLAKAGDRYPGLVLQEGVIRVYPYKSVACQTIGHVANVTAETIAKDPEPKDPLRKYKAFDRYGQEGMEKLFERDLRGTRGVAATNYGNGGETQEQPAVPGKDVQTTLDIELQAAVEQSFRHVNFVRHSELPNEQLDMPGAAVLIDVPTGEVRAMVSWPTYDLNDYNDIFPQLLRDQWRRPLTNRATQMAVEPGSTVKPIIGISAITAGVFGPNETIQCDGYVVIGGRRYTSFGKCWTARMFNGKTHQQVPSAAPHPTGFLTFPEALQRSCNVFHEELAWRLGMGGVSFWFDKFGLGKPTGIGLPEAKGVLPDSYSGPAAQKMAVTCMAGIGESHVNATPIQMANVAATIARNGIAVKPTLLEGERNDHVDLHLSPAAVAEAHEGDVRRRQHRGGHGAHGVHGRPRRRRQDRLGPNRAAAHQRHRRQRPAHQRRQGPIHLERSPARNGNEPDARSALVPCDR